MHFGSCGVSTSKKDDSWSRQEHLGGGHITGMNEDSWEEFHEDEMGIGGICDRQYGYMRATDCLNNLGGTSGKGATIATVTFFNGLHLVHVPMSP